MNVSKYVDTLNTKREAEIFYVKTTLKAHSVFMNIEYEEQTTKPVKTLLILYFDITYFFILLTPYIRIGKINLNNINFKTS